MSCVSRLPEHDWAAAVAWCGPSDLVTFSRAQPLRDRGVEVRYDVYPDEGHTFGNRENQTKARSDAADFLLAHLTRRAVPPSRGPVPAH